MVRDCDDLSCTVVDACLQCSEAVTHLLFPSPAQRRSAGKNGLGPSRPEPAHTISVQWDTTAPSGSTIRPRTVSAWAGGRGPNPSESGRRR